MPIVDVSGLKVRFGRRYSFTAAHRLHSTKLGDARSREIYGKCNNPAGHGHNYTVTVVVEGEPDSVTGMVLNMVELDRIGVEIMEHFGYRHLDIELPEFRDRPSTAEHIAETLFVRFSEALASFDGVLLRRLEISETRNNSCCLALIDRAA